MNRNDRLNVQVEECPVPQGAAAVEVELEWDRNNITDRILGGFGQGPLEIVKSAPGPPNAVCHRRRLD